jgi:hypothetical protein
MLAITDWVERQTEWGIQKFVLSRFGMAKSPWCAA